MKLHCEVRFKKLGKIKTIDGSSTTEYLVQGKNEEGRIISSRAYGQQMLIETMNRLSDELAKPGRPAGITNICA